MCRSRYGNFGGIVSNMCSDVRGVGGFELVWGGGGGVEGKQGEKDVTASALLHLRSERHSLYFGRNRDMEMLVDFPGGARVDAHWDGFTVRTDQPPSGGGESSAPAPFDYFLASLVTCAGIYVLGFCRSRGLPTENIRLIQRTETDPATHLVKRVNLEVELPPDFPEKYKPAVIRAAEQCKVKKHLENPPEMVVTTVTAEVVPA